MEKFNKIRKTIYSVIDPLRQKTRAGLIYDSAILVVIILSIIPLMFKTENGFLVFLDIFCVTIFIIDYILRWATADFKFKDHSLKSFLKYPITPMAIIDLLSILPTFTFFNEIFKLLRLFRAARIIRLVRVAKFARYSQNVQLLCKILKKCARSLITVAVFAISYVIIASLVVFNAEPDSFNSYFDAMYWVIVIWNHNPVSVAGHIVAICSVIFGLTLVALPVSIISAEYIEHIRNIRHKTDLKKEIAIIEKDVEENLEKDLEHDLEKDLDRELKKDIPKEKS